MEAEHNGQVVEIYPHECLELLHTEKVGRIGVVFEGRPEIFPVNYSLDASDAIIFRTAIGTKLPSAVNHHVVFEVDHFESDSRTGWSVVVHGVAQQTDYVTEGQDELVPWRDDTPYLVRIAQLSMTGRRIQKLPADN
jgi:nitroimidazol reductase NimA-like FMN-containing flavoprotein (pyridoxamine 5'-phosphate oxidase superfamily)